MITYYIWSYLTDFYYYDDAFERISHYSLAFFVSLFTIPVDILALPFYIIGLIIFLITELIEKKKENR